MVARHASSSGMQWILAGPRRIDSESGTRPDAFTICGAKLAKQSETFRHIRVPRSTSGAVIVKRVDIGMLSFE